MLRFYFKCSIIKYYEKTTKFLSDSRRDLSTTTWFKYDYYLYIILGWMNIENLTVYFKLKLKQIASQQFLVNATTTPMFLAEILKVWYK